MIPKIKNREFFFIFFIFFDNETSIEKNTVVRDNKKYIVVFFNHTVKH